MRKYLTALIAALVAMAGLVGVVVPTLANHEIVIGLQCDRTGATQIVGTVLCPGVHDYIALVNSKGGVEGHKIKAMEIHHEYKVPQGVEAYERHKKEGAVTMAIYGTPHIYALAAKLTEDRIPGTSPGFSRSQRRRITRSSSVSSAIGPARRRSSAPCSAPDSTTTSTS